jgi:hypothetical protein
MCENSRSASLILILLLLVSCQSGSDLEPEAPEEETVQGQTLEPVPQQIRQIDVGQNDVQQVASVPQEPPPPEVPAPPAAPTDVRVSGPYAHDNLALYLIHREDPGLDPEAGSTRLVTLAEALASQTVVVHETGNVNALAVENRSDSCTVFIQAGDIVRGGKQDRVLAVDMLLPPDSGKVPINAFCVESGRWSRRGQEAVAGFTSSTKMVMGNDLKLAVQQHGSQSMVWDQVRVSQGKLATNAGVASVAASESPTSLELSLEHQQVKEKVAAYTRALLPHLDGQPQVVGLAIAVNGTLRSADTYSSTRLFAQLREKLLEAAATEALSLRDEPRAAAPPSPAAVRAWLGRAEQGTATAHAIADRQVRVTRERPDEVLFETRLGDAVLHRTYLRK